jgi:hypothetical protein
MARRPSFRFDDIVGRFRGRSGRFIASSTIRGYLDRALDGHGKAISALTEQLRARAITLGQWERAMRTELKHIHLYSATLAKGGRFQLSQADFGRIGRELRDQYDFLRTFADAIASGKQPVDGRLVARAKLYAQSGRSTYHLTERAEMERRGWDLEENVLAASEHCAGCLAETARGKVSIGSLVPIGQRTCRTNDRCRIRYSNSATGAVAA